MKRPRSPSPHHPRPKQHLRWCMVSQWGHIRSTRNTQVFSTLLYSNCCAFRIPCLSCWFLSGCLCHASCMEHGIFPSWFPARLLFLAWRTTFTDNLWPRSWPICESKWLEPEKHAISVLRSHLHRIFSTHPSLS